MRNSILLSAVFLALYPACDSPEIESQRNEDEELNNVDQQADLAVDAELDLDDLEVPEVEAPPPAAPDSWLAFSDDAEPTSFGPPGTVCCAQCGDYSSYWYNVGDVENCTSRAIHWCADHGFSFIDAAWRPPYTSVQCY